MNRNGPTEYMPRDPIVAMKVCAPYKTVADWCGGEIATTGGTRKFAFIAVKTQGQTFHAVEGSYIEKINSDYYTAGPVFAVWEQGTFESRFRRVEK